MNEVVYEFNARSYANLRSMEVALAISIILFGILLTQVSNYCQHIDNRWFLKFLVTIISVLELFHTFTITHAIYWLTVTMAARPDPGPNSYPLSIGVVLETLITALVQSRRAFSPIASTGFRTRSTSASLAESYLDVPRQTDAFVLTDNYDWSITLAISVGAFVDVLVAGSLCYYIKRLTPRWPSQSMGALVDRLVTGTIQTGLITSFPDVSTITHATQFHTAGRTEIWFAVYTVLAKLYSNSFLASLNVRQRPDQDETAPSSLVFTNHLRPEATKNSPRVQRHTCSKSLPIPQATLIL
ncbi:hypothetical protein LshimejAT787_0100340 [Lyophyllum shimeji]|uniref:DUF6534 domain-containing protein n=1 Tax=Lyophyllum shimeji TaxID=47721 RepID=A0A9P3PCX0_LYOSH|nr:hypothetical protein LshimejAT787_0100340 [Lyophyllum shimeji]